MPMVEIPALHAAAPLDASPPVSDRSQRAHASGVQWAQDVQRALRLENRRAAGGWPGTMREARTRASHLLATLRADGVIATQEETTTLAKAVYASARSTWRANAESEDRDTVDG
jgi:hypothetical protein